MMKKQLIIIVCALIPLMGFAKEKVSLVDLIAKNEKIPVAVYAWSTIKRSPEVVSTSTSDNKAEFSRKLQYQIVDSVVTSLNKAFNTKAFYKLVNPPKKKEDFKEKGFKLWVIVDLGGTYTMTTGTKSSFVFKISLAQYFHSVDESGKIKRSAYGSKIVYDQCEPVTEAANIKLARMMEINSPDCVIEKAVATLNKNNYKFAEKLIQKANK